MTGDLPDRLTQEIGVLKRREAEARVLAPFVEALCTRFDRTEVIEMLRGTIERLAREQGAQLAAEHGRGVAAFRETLQFWTRDGALEMDVFAADEERLDFDVTRCRYAEMYRALGIAELGAVLSCNRDAALIEGFDPKATLQRDQTIMGGAPCCTFRYRFPVEGIELEE